MIKITDINIWSYISGTKVNQQAMVGNPITIEVEIVENNWMYVRDNHNSWQNIKNKYANWNEVKNI